MPPRINRLEVILKTAERCNIACSYCYYFFHGDESYRARPPIIRLPVVKGVAAFLRDGCRDLSIPHVKVVFHGGEPMLQRLEQFSETCGLLREALDDVTSLELSIQTNGMLISDAWLEVLREHDVSLGVSIDGPQGVHDRARLDHRGRGTYSRVVEGIRRAQTFRSRNAPMSVGALTVINADYNYRDVVRHLSHDLDLRRLSFLLPDCSYESGVPGGHSPRDYGESLCEIFDAWLEDESLSIREIEKVLSHFQVRKSDSQCDGAGGQAIDSDRSFGWNQIIVIRSDGAVNIDDSLVPAGAWHHEASSSDVHSGKLVEYLSAPIFDEIRSAQISAPSACRDCIWLRICGGGDLENRFSSGRGFDNPSVFCEGLKLFYAHVVGHLVQHGYPRAMLERKLKSA